MYLKEVMAAEYMPPNRNDASMSSLPLSLPKQEHLSADVKPPYGATSLPLFMQLARVSIISYLGSICVSVQFEPQQTSGASKR